MFGIARLVRIAPGVVIFEQLRKGNNSIVKGQLSLFLQINKSGNLPVAVNHERTAAGAEQSATIAEYAVFFVIQSCWPVHKDLQGFFALVWHVFKGELAVLNEIPCLLFEVVCTRRATFRPDRPERFQPQWGSHEPCP